MRTNPTPRNDAPPPAFDAERFKTDMRTVFLHNEASAAQTYKLSFAKEAKSGYSFGPAQLDTANNSRALAAYQDILDSYARENPGKIAPNVLEQIKRAAEKSGKSGVIEANISFIDAALSSEAGRQKVDIATKVQFDELAKEMKNVINQVPENSNAYDFVNSRQGQALIADWINQSGPASKLIDFVKGEKVTFEGKATKTIQLDKPLDAEGWRDYLKATKHGQEDVKGDVDRRINNILKTIKEPDKKGEAPPAGTPERTPASQAFQQRLESPHENAAWQTALKDPASWTSDEAKQVMADYTGRPSSDPMKGFLQDLTSQHFRHVYGDGPMAADATGKRIDREINPPPGIAKPLDRPEEGLVKFGGGMADLIDREGETNAVKALQGGLNLAAGDSVFPKLLEDGDYGPYTDFALRRTFEHRGPGAIDEALALGRWRDTAPKAGQDPETLSGSVGQIFGPLYGEGGAGHEDAATAFQIGLNDLGSKQSGDSWEPLKLDGNIGPKTTGAFNSLLGLAGPDALARQFGESAGFI
jgi:hypothetical protein